MNSCDELVGRVRYLRGCAQASQKEFRAYGAAHTTVNEIGARVWQGAGIAGSGWQRAGLGRHAGQGALAVLAAGCRIMRKVWWSVGERRRGLVEIWGDGRASAARHECIQICRAELCSSALVLVFSAQFSCSLWAQFSCFG